MPIWSLRPSAPQKTLVGTLGFPPAEAMRRLARKVVFSTVSASRLREVRDAIRRAPGLVGNLSHLHRLNANVPAVRPAAIFGRARARAAQAGRNRSDP